MPTKKLCIVFGTRPEYLKVRPLIRALRHSGSIRHLAVQICQHADLVPEPQDDVCVLQLDAARPASSDRLASLGAGILHTLPGLLLRECCTHLLVQGDTATAFYACLCGFQADVAVVHLEAGLRTYDRASPFPEEAYRQMIARMASLHLVPHVHNARLLRAECVQGTVVVTGNTILDTVRGYGLRPVPGDSVLVTWHRRESRELLPALVEQLKRAMAGCDPALSFHWFLHPNPGLQAAVRVAVREQGLCSSSNSSDSDSNSSSDGDLHLHLHDPMEHQAFCEQLAHCRCVVTDSGGIQEEAAFLGKPCLVIRSCTERDQIPQPTHLQLVPPPFDTLNSCLANVPRKPLEPCYAYGNGHACEAVLAAVASSTF